MSIEVGGAMGTTYVWRDKVERWHHDCTGAKKFRVDKIKRAEHTRGVDAWKYVKHVAVPLMWPEFQRRLQDNPEFVEDGAASQCTIHKPRTREARYLKIRMTPSQ